MRILKRFIIVFVGLFAILFGGAYFLPSTVIVSRDITIAAGPDKVFPYVNDLKKFQTWSPWAALDPEMKIQFSGPQSGVGQKSNWQSKKSSVGSGDQEITQSIVNKRVATKLDLGDNGTAIAAWDLSPDGQGTKVVWSFKTELGDNPLMRWMGLMFDRMVGSDFEAGLARLKMLVEAQK